MAETPFPTRREFPQEGAVVNFPGQARAIQVQQLALGGIESMPAAPGGFRPFRLVINLKIVFADQPDSEVATFDPPIELRVRYTAADLQNAAAAGQPLSLGFWDGKQWIRFTDKKHQFHLEPGTPAQAGGWAVASISHWGDPTIGVGT